MLCTYPWAVVVANIGAIGGGGMSCSWVRCLWPWRGPARRGALRWD
jgi:hypothetical protein